MSAANATVLADASRSVLENPGQLPKATWPRTSALLARQAIESAVADYLAARAPGLETCSRATQFTCLPWYANNRATARLAFQTWAALSEACHHHAYDLAPTASELRAWID